MHSTFCFREIWTLIFFFFFQTLLSDDQLPTVIKARDANLQSNKKKSLLVDSGTVYTRTVWLFPPLSQIFGFWSSPRVRVGISITHQNLSTESRDIGKSRIFCYVKFQNPYISNWWILRTVRYPFRSYFTFPERILYLRFPY